MPLGPGTRRGCSGRRGRPVGGGHIVTHRCSIWVVADHWAIHALNTPTPKALAAVPARPGSLQPHRLSRKNSEIRSLVGGVGPVPQPGPSPPLPSASSLKEKNLARLLLMRQPLPPPLPGAPAATASALMSLGRTWSQQGSDTSPEEKSPGDECLFYPTERSMTMPTTSEQVGSPSRKVLPGGQEVMPSDMLPLLPLIPLFAWH